MYRVNEIFHSLQGEGVRAGTVNVFVRFTWCNLKCDIEPGPLSPGGFACDSEFASGVNLEGEAIVSACKALAPNCRSVIFTGGEPTLQLDEALIKLFKEQKYFIAIETNGTREVPDGVDWITLSPKVAEHAIKVKSCTEVKYVRASGQGVPKPSTAALYKLISPAFDGHQVNSLDLKWCIQLVKENPEWRLSVQQHKGWAVR